MLRYVSCLLALMGVLAAAARAEVEIAGLEDTPRDNVLAYLALDELACDAPERRVRQEYQAAPAQIDAALQAFGFYAATVESSLAFEAECWQARFEIAPGEPVRVRGLNVRVEGAAADDPVFARALAEDPLMVGEPLRHAAYDSLKRRLSDLARDRGYASAAFTSSRIDIHPAELAADVTLHFDSGPRYSFGAILLEQDVLSESFVRSYVGFQPGDPYLNRQLTALYVALSDSGYFETVDVRPMPADHDARSIPVAVRLTPAPRRLVSYGVGFSSDTGPRLRFGRNNRRWNERGHQFGTNAQLSPVISEFTANYRFPYGDPRFDWVSFDAGAKREVTDTAESESLEFGARRVLDSPGGWTRTQMLNLVVEDFEIGEQIGRSRLLMPGVEWARIRADNTLRPTRGFKLSLELRVAADALGSDTSFLQSVAEGKWIRSLANAGRIIVRGQLGATWEEAFRELPPSVRFFTGGDHTVRGYGFETLGPENAAGEVIGGSRLVTTSFEYEHPLKPRWSMAFFVDSGNAFDGSRIEAKTGAGLGARWQSPLGPIRFDVAAPLDGDGGLRLHVNLGPDL